METKTYLWLLGAAVLVFFWPAVLHPTAVLSAGDLTQVYSYYYWIMREEWDSDVFSLWDPYNYGGMPHKLPTASFYPVSLLFLFSFRAWYLNYYIIFHILIAGLGMYGFLRALDFEKQSGFIGALIFMLSGNLVSRIAGHIPQMTVYSLLPLGFLFLELVIQKKRWLFGIPLAFVLALQILTEHFQYVFYSFFALLIYGIYRILQEKRPLLSLGLVALAGIVAVSLSLPAFVPTLNFLPLLSRIDGNIGGGDFAYASSLSLPPYHMVGLALPWFFGRGDLYWGAPNFTELYMYMGVLGLVLAVVSFWNKMFRHRWFFWGMLGVSLIIMFGSFTPLFYLIFKLIPAFAYLRTPSRFLMIFSFCFAVLTASGMSLVLSRSLKENLWGWTLGIGAVFSGISLIGGWFLKDWIISLGKLILEKLYFGVYQKTIFVQQHSFESLVARIPEVYSTIMQSLLFFTLFFVASIILLILYSTKRISNKAFFFSASAVLILDLAVFGNVFIQPIYSEELYRSTPVVDFLRQSEGRFLSRHPDLVPAHLVGKYHLQNLLGYGSSRIIFFDRFLDEGLGIIDDVHKKVKWGQLIVPVGSLETDYIAKLLGMAGVRFIVSDELVKNIDFVFVDTIDGAFVYENVRALPKAYIVYRAVRSDDAFSLVRKDSFDPNMTVILERGVIGGMPKGAYRVEVVEGSPERMRIEAMLDKPGYLVLTESYFPGWKAFDNGREIEILLANGFQRAVWLDAGEHEVIFKYSPKYFTASIIVSGIALLLFLISSLVYAWTIIKCNNNETRTNP